MDEERESETGNTDKESVQLFTLANFEHTYPFSEQHMPSGVPMDLTGVGGHVQVADPLPDLMSDTFRYRPEALQPYEMDTREQQHHNLFIIQKPTTEAHVGDMGHDLVSFAAATNTTSGEPHHHSQLGCDRYRTLPNVRGRHSMHIALQPSSKGCSLGKRTPSVDGIDLVGWIRSEQTRSPCHRPQCLARRCSTEQVFTQADSFPLHINCDQVP